MSAAAVQAAAGNGDEWAVLTARAPQLGSNDAPLPGSTSRHAGPVDDHRRQQLSSTLRALDHRLRPGPHSRRRHRPHPHRGVQAQAASPTSISHRPAIGDQHHPTTPPADESVLRSDHRLGLRRRTPPQPDHSRRRPAPSRAAAKVPRRRPDGHVHAPRRDRTRPAPQTLRPAPGSHRDARR